MTARRLVLTAGAMAVIGVLLNWLAPGMPAMLAALRDPQRLADTSGPGALLLAVVGGLAWLAWAWGALGLLLTGLGAMPGLIGWTARQLLHVVLPAGARRAAAVALGVGVALNAPLLAGTALAAPAAPSATTDVLIPDWPAAAPTTTPAGTTRATTTPAVPDWPVSGSAAAHVVVSGDCLWDIAADHLSATAGRPADDAEIARSTGAWWTANATVIGPDPDLLLPGQVLRPPDAP